MSRSLNGLSTSRPLAIIFFVFLISPMRCYMPRPSNSPRFYLNDTGWGLQKMKLLYVQFSPAFCCLFPLGSKYPPQHPIRKHLQCTLFPSRDRPCFNPQVCTYVGVCHIPYGKRTQLCLDYTHYTRDRAVAAQGVVQHQNFANHRADTSVRSHWSEELFYSNFRKE
jgi:hypothetical protein